MIFAEEERESDYQSPQFENDLVVSKSSEVDCAQDVTSKLQELSIQDSSRVISHEHDTVIQPVSSSETPSNETNTVESTKKVLVSDLECGVCKQLLYRPIVLNCGHGKPFPNISHLHVGKIGLYSLDVYHRLLLALQSIVNRAFIRMIVSINVRGVRVRILKGFQTYACFYITSSRIIFPKNIQQGKRV